MKKYINKGLGVDQIPYKLIQAELYGEVHKFIVLIWKNEELPQELKESIIVPILKKDNKMDTVIIIDAFNFYLLHIKFFRTYFPQE